MRSHDWPPAHELADAVRRGERKASELLDAALEAIDAIDPLLNAWVELDIDGARVAARSIDDAVARGEDPGPLAGVPMGVKDMDDLAGLPTREGSAILRDAPPAERDSIHVSRLRAAGAVFVGKTTTPEFGFSSQTTSVAHGTTRNPWNRSTTPGGSSGGSAAAVSSGMVPLATAGDGGGSTRTPAAFTGLVGLKPSHGRIPALRTGDVAVVGTLATSVLDAARHLDVAAGPHNRDHQSLPAPGLSYERAAQTLDLSGLRAAWSADLGWLTVDPEIADASEQAMRAAVAASGMTLVDRPFRLPNLTSAWVALSIESLLRRLVALGAWPDRAGELDPGVRALLDVRSRFTLAQLYEAELRKRSVLDATAELFDDVDVLFTPATAMVAPPAVGPPPDTVAGRDARLSGAVPFGMFVNWTWIPAISVPCGMHSSGLPMGLQIAAGRHRDEIPLRLARLLELEHPWPRRPASIDETEPVDPPVAPAPPIDIVYRFLAWGLDPSHDGTDVGRLMSDLAQALSGDGG